MDALTLANNSTLSWDLGAPGQVGGGSDDLVVVNGDLTLDGYLSLTMGQGFSAGTYTLFTYGGRLTDNGLYVGFIGNGISATIDLSTPGEVNLDVTAVPEPGALACMVGMGALLFQRRRHCKGSAA